MQSTLETIAIATLTHVTGGGFGGYGGMLQSKTGHDTSGKGLGETLGGGGFGLNGRGGGLAETVGGFARNLIGGSPVGGVVEGK